MKGVTVVSEREITIRIRDERRRQYTLEDRPGVFALQSQRWWRKGKRPKRDSMRQKCYDAETEVRPQMSNRKFENLEDAAAYLRDTMETDWFQRRWPKFVELRIRYSPQTVGAHASPNRSNVYYLREPDARLPVAVTLPTAGRITAGPWAVPREEVWLHELAHCIIPGGHQHDRLWVRTFLELVRLRMGRETHDLLRDAFRRKRVKFAPYRQVQPTEEMLEKLAACRPAAMARVRGARA